MSNFCIILENALEEAGPFVDRSDEGASQSNSICDPESEKTNSQVTANPNRVSTRTVKTVEEMFELANLHAHGKIQNLGLPLIRISKLEILLYMQMFHEKIQSLQKLGKLDPDFAGMACSALFIFWKDYHLVGMTLVNIHKVAKIATDDVKLELRDKKVILAASLAICFQGQQNDKDFLNYFDDSIEFVLVIFYYGPIQYPGQPVIFHHKIISALMMIVPYIVDHLKRNESNVEKFSWILKNLLLTMEMRYRTSEYNKLTMVKDWLIKHGVVSYVFEYMKDYQFGTSENFDVNFMRLIDIAFILKLDAQLENTRSIVPNLLKFMDIDTFGSFKASAIQHFKPVRVVGELLRYIVGNVTADTVEYLLTWDFIRTILNAMSFHRDLQELMSETLLKAIDKFKDASQTEKGSKMSVLVVKELCTFAEPYIVPSNDLKMAYSKIICYAAGHLNVEHEQFILESLKNGAFVLMMKAFTISCFENDCEDGDRSSQSRFGMYMLDLINHFTCEDKQSSFTGMTKIVCETLPEIVTQYSNGEHVAVDSKYCHVITILVLHSLESINDFNSTRWKGIRYLMLLNYAHAVVEKSLQDSTSLIFMWKMISFNMSEIFLPSLKQIEIDLRKCDKMDTETLSAIEDLKVRSLSTENCFDHLVMHLRSSLDGSDGERFCILRFRRITRLLYKMAENNKSKYQLKMLRGLVFLALDVVTDYRDTVVEDNVNNFIIHLFLNPRH